MSEHVSGNVQRINPNMIPFVLQIGDNHKITTYINALDRETVGKAVDRLRAFVDELSFDIPNAIRDVASSYEDAAEASTEANEATEECSARTTA